MYSKEQSEALKEAFLRTEYPSYRDRLRLAARLHLDEHRVQVRAPAPLGRPSARPGPPVGTARPEGLGLPRSRSKQGVSPLWTQGWTPAPLNPGLYHPANRIRPA